MYNHNLYDRYVDYFWQVIFFKSSSNYNFTNTCVPSLEYILPWRGANYHLLPLYYLAFNFASYILPMRSLFVYNITSL